jgi:VIT1/CCC1 family predicted Fe2+/Mn2+ transporter
LTDDFSFRSQKNCRGIRQLHTDTERADLSRERKELAGAPEQEREELTAIYLERGLEPKLAYTVASQLMEHDVLGAHARD